METRDLIFYDRSRVTTDWACPRRRFWNYEYARRGIAPVKRSIYLEVGDRIHTAMADLLLDGEVDRVATRQRSIFEANLRGGMVDRKMDEIKIIEQGTILEGMIRGWDRFYRPLLLRDYRPLAVEGELFLDHDGCRMMCKPDVVAERVSDSSIWYPEWKTTGSMKREWFAQWGKAVQLHGTAKAIEAHLGRPVAGVIVFGLYKGYESQYGRQESAFGYGYGPRGGLDDRGLMYRYVNGLSKYPIWETTDSKTWVEGMPLDVLEKQFGETGPIFLNTHLCERWLRQTAIRERTIREGIERIERAFEENDQGVALEVLDSVFPQHFDECSPGWGLGCSYADVCWTPGVERDPIRSGLYTWRTPHHAGDPAFQVQEEVV